MNRMPSCVIIIVAINSWARLAVGSAPRHHSAQGRRLKREPQN